MPKLSIAQKYQVCVDYIESEKATLLHAKPTIESLRTMIQAKSGLGTENKISSGNVSDALQHVYGEGITSFRHTSKDKNAAFNELQKTCNHMIGWIIKLIESGEVADWLIYDLRNDPFLPDEIRNAQPRTTLCVKKSG